MQTLLLVNRNYNALMIPVLHCMCLIFNELLVFLTGQYDVRFWRIQDGPSGSL